MASVLWISVFLLLCVEAIVAALLCFQITARAIVQVVEDSPLGKNIRYFSQFVIFGLVVGLWDSVNTIRRLEQREQAAMGIDGYAGGHGAHGTRHHPYGPTGANPQTDLMFYSVDRPRKFRAERNLYLTAFSLALMFIIQTLIRLTKLLIRHEKKEEESQKEIAELHDKIRDLSGLLNGPNRTTTSPNSIEATSVVSDANTEQQRAESSSPPDASSSEIQPVSQILDPGVRMRATNTVPAESRKDQ
eukprot:CAMPEP_0184691238 /NCGR_PEP_ID=MMETSP0313-20130426/140_1 /TAXON_ID=2792 /ORGANISM="Porphyridium aerugineum, Strain SAG 1380-2" /LENGTH=245 /DNA_ID=CAMNT_0027148915 /DNA_START=244 /DNA_END=981 /DNA_ORIENTATION=+